MFKNAPILELRCRPLPLPAKNSCVPSQRLPIVRILLQTLVGDGQRSRQLMLANRITNLVLPFLRLRRRPDQSSGNNKEQPAWKKFVHGITVTAEDNLAKVTKVTFVNSAKETVQNLEKLSDNGKNCRKPRL